MDPVIGLFGTCGNSTWRTPYMAAYKERGIAFYNPQKENWSASDTTEENRHLNEDDIILFPVTFETTAGGSLGEIGFCINRILRSFSVDRYVVILIDDACSDPTADARAIKLSNNARALVKSKVAEDAALYRNVYLVKSLEEMLALSVELYDHIRGGREIRARFAPIA